MKRHHIMQHPGGFWIAAITTMLFFFSFATVLSLLVLYLIQNFHFSTALANNTSIGFYSLIFILPLAGGYIGEKIGYRFSITMGLLVATLGTFFIALPNLDSLYIGMALFLTGNAFIIPTLWSLIGLLYDDKDGARASAYTLYYLVFNVGALGGVVFAGFLSSSFGFHSSFVLSAIVILVGLVFFISLSKRITLASGNSIAPQWQWPLLVRLLVFIVTTIAIGLYAFFLMRNIQYNNLFLGILGGLTTIGLFLSAVRQKTQAKRNGMIIFWFMCIILTLFTADYYLESSSIIVFALQNVDRQIGSFNIPPSVYYSLDQIFVIILGFLLSLVWAYLAKYKRDPKPFTKISFGLIAAGIGFLIFVWGMHYARDTYYMHSGWMVFGYAFLSLAELLINPICMAMVGVLMPKGRESLGMGVLQIFFGVAGTLGTYLASLSNVPTTATAAQSFPIFYEAFAKIGLGSLLAGLVAFLVLRPMVRYLFKYE